MLTVFPPFLAPDAISRSPTSTRSSVDLPEPLMPTSPIRSPGPMRHVTSSSSSRGPSGGGAGGGRGGGCVLGVERVFAEPLAGEAVQLHGVPRLRHVGDQRLRGLDAVPG